MSSALRCGCQLATSNSISVARAALVAASAGQRPRRHSRPAGQKRHASSSSTAANDVPLDEKLVRLARQTLSKAAEDNAAATASGNAIEAAKRTKQLEGLREALKTWQDNATLRRSLEDVVYSDPDEEMRELASADLEELDTPTSEALQSLKDALLPPDATSALGCLMEIKAGVGGSEASIFAGDLMRMYSRHATSRNWKAEIVNASAVNASAGGGGGGPSDAYREVILEVDGMGAYEALRFEAGVHRVQRVPATETQGRVHTSTASVIVLPSAPDKDPALDKVLDGKDVKIEVMRSGGAGGQHVNRTESAVRLTHLPTGITVSMQDTRSQHKNRAKAFQVLRSRLLALQVAETQASDRAARRAQVRGQDRSEKIRTYNFAQDRVTDHRIPLTLSGVEGFLEGDDGSLEIMAHKLNQWALQQQVDEMLEGAQ